MLIKSKSLDRLGVKSIEFYCESYMRGCGKALEMQGVATNRAFCEHERSKWEVGRGRGRARASVFPLAFGRDVTGLCQAETCH